MRANRMRSILNPGGPWAVVGWIGGLFFASISAVLGACNGTQAPGAPGGSLAIVVESDMMIPRDIDHIRVDVTQNGSSLLHVDADVGPAATLIPALYQVKATTDSSPVNVQAVGYQAGQLRVERDAITPIPTDHEGVLRLALNYLCVGEAQAEADGGVTSTCPAGLTCQQGSCQNSTVPPSSVPTYDPATVNGSALLDASVEGGAGVGCFDVQDCFASALPVTLDVATCSITLPAGAAGAGVNIALQFPPGGAGVCSDKDCWVVLNEGSDWTESGTTVSLPPGACTSPAAKSAVIVVTTACASKTEATPECGAWSSVPTPAVVPGMMAPLAASCMGPSSQACGNCGTETRSCINGAWSDWSTCTGTGVCAPNATQACEESGTQTCGANCQWGDCGCTAGESACGSTCVTLSTDVHNCGACGTDCTMLAHVNGASATCAAGHCTYGCAAGYADCSDAGAGCTASLSAATSCGACGFVCSIPSPMCAPADAGAPSTCLSQCSGAASMMCNGSCIDPETDPGNCGGCGKACAAGSTCVTGVCTCQGPMTQACGKCGSETRTCTDGVWSTWSSCTGEKMCGPGATQACDGNGSESCGTDCMWATCVCNPGDTLCGTACVNEQTDPQNCGNCGAPCPSGAQCTGGACVCPPGTHACGDFCDNNLSLASCGGNCDSPCPAPANGTATCNGIACGIACNMGLSACGSACVNEQVDNANCGSCGNTCTTSDPNASGASCNGSGMCVTTCKMGYSLCDGVCVNEQADNANCGSCDNACTGGVCTEGACCTNACSPGQTACLPGGLAACTLGTEGCWTYGPPEVCGPQQSCTGAAGSAECSCDQGYTSCGSTCVNNDTACTPATTRSCIEGAQTQTCSDTCQWAGTCNVDFDYDRFTDAQTFVVPGGVTQLQFEVLGAGFCGGGAIVEFALSVTPGDTFSIYVGGDGGGNGSNRYLGGAGGTSSADPGDISATGGGEGAPATYVTNGSGDVVVVAGGAGGCGGTFANQYTSFSGSGGAGGTPNGGNGGSGGEFWTGQNIVASMGGTGATSAAGGTGGARGTGFGGVAGADGSDGSAGAGGVGADIAVGGGAGGGGGGGYFGGGGGGSGGDGNAGAGGGGGSSWVIPIATGTSMSVVSTPANGSVRISY